MMFLVKLALKNLVRHRKRTFITAGIIAMALFIYIMIDSLLIGINDITYNNLINLESGHLQIVNKTYWEEKDELPLDNLINSDEIKNIKFTNIEGFKGLITELDFKANLNNGVNGIPIIVKGINPDNYKNVFSLNKFFTEGEMFSKGDYRVVMGEKLAELMKFKTGDYLTLLIRTKNDTFNTIEAEISGLLNSSNTNVNRNIVYLPLDIAQRALNVEGQISHFIIKLENKNIAENTGLSLEKKINNINDNLGVYTWSELEAVTFLKAKQSVNQLILLIILVIAAIAIINTVILAALERMEEIGMMKAMGLKIKEIIFTFVLESTGIGLLGGIAGILIGILGVSLLNKIGIDYVEMFNIDMASFGVPIIEKFYGAWHPEAFIFVFFFGVFVSLISSILPAYWAASKDPVEAIYHR